MGKHKQKFWDKYNSGVEPRNFVDWSMDKSTDILNEYYKAFDSDFLEEEEKNKPLREKKARESGVLTVQDLIDKLQSVEDKNSVVMCNEYYITNVSKDGYLGGTYFEDIDNPL